MLDRASIVNEQFYRRLEALDFPAPQSNTNFAEAGLDKQAAIALFDCQIKSRLLDIIARELKEKGLSFYTIGSSGHEGNAAVAAAFGLSDMAFLHYRSGGFYLARARQREGHDGVNDIILSLVAAASDPISGGRHKVFGSVPLNIPPQTSTIASHLPKALGAALGIERAVQLGVQSALAEDAVIVCSFGDASLNHASAQTTLNAAGWFRARGAAVPLVFVCEDNGIGISVATPEGWVAQSVKARPGIEYVSCDGLNIADVYAKSQFAMLLARHKKIPVFLHMRCVRLLGHAGSDIESQYLAEAIIEANEANDPLLHTARMLIEAGFMSADAILDLYRDNRKLIEVKARAAIQLPRMQNKTDVMASIVPQYPRLLAAQALDETKRRDIFAGQYAQLAMKRNLCQNINLALTDLMLNYPQILVFGEDVGKKGGVYRVTADLQARFGAARVFDTLLDETTILGTAIGFAHHGLLPIAEIQFLAYLHNAEDQLRGEAATLSFFSSGQYQNPMVIRIAGLAYQKGFGGHFHNDNSFAVLRDIPGVIVACPSNGADAAKMLRTAVQLAAEQGRVVVFLEPIALYMTKDLHASGDNAWLCEYPKPGDHIPLGEVGVFGEGDTVILTYANGYYLSRQAEKILAEQHHIAVKIVDMRWLSPLPEAAILNAVAQAKRVLIVDEGRRTGSVSEAIMALLMERGPDSLSVSRITGEDCFIPLGTAWEYVLPSKNSIIAAVLAMHNKREKERGRFVVSG